MALFQLIYMSTLAEGDTTVLASILESSVKNNKRRNITGMMLCADDNVVQVLEGPKDQVLETFQAIASDSRHNGLFVLIEQDIASRQFASWSMGFRQLSKADLAKFPQAGHVFKAREDEIATRIRAGDALTILQSFAEGSMSVT